MNPERRRQVDPVFKSALEVPAEGRAAFVERARAGDGAPSAQVQSLAAHAAGRRLPFAEPSS